MARRNSAAEILKVKGQREEPHRGDLGSFRSGSDTMLEEEFKKRGFSLHCI